MSDRIKKLVLNALLEKYERSSLFKEGKQSARRIILNFYDGGKCDFPFYDIEQAERRISVNQAVIDLSKEKLLDYSWMKGEHNHIIAKVWLSIDNLSSAYQVAGRQPKGDVIDKICMEITSIQNRVESTWAANFLHDMHDAITRKRSLVSAIPANDTERSLMFQAISAIDKLGGAEYMERVFSLRTFGNSKTFERDVKSRILSILRKYLDNDDDATDEDILRQVGIVKYPEQFEFCGNISVAFNSGVIDFSHLQSGGTIFSSDLSSGSITICPSVESVLTIENRANYVEYIRRIKTEKELVIYHGGQFSPRKREFLQMVAKALPKNCKWYHWSDIDYGGFIMLSRLRREIASAVIPYRMSVSELERYSNLAAPTSAAYTEKLKKLKSCNELSDCYDCIEYMIKNRLRLEQEAMLIREGEILER